MNIISKTTQIPPSASEFFMEHGGIQLHMKLDVPESKAVSLPLVILVHGFTGHMEEPHLLGARDKTLEKGAACLRVEMSAVHLSGISLKICTCIVNLNGITVFYRNLR